MESRRAGMTSLIFPNFLQFCDRHLPAQKGFAWCPLQGLNSADFLWYVDHDPNNVLGCDSSGLGFTASDFTVSKPAAFGSMSWNAKSRYAATLEWEIQIYAFLERFENERPHAKNSCIALLSGSLVLLRSYALMFTGFAQRSRVA